MFTPRYDESESDEVSNSESDDGSEDGNGDALNYEEDTIHDDDGIAGCQGSPVLPEEDKLDISISCRTTVLEHLQDMKLSTDKLD